MNKRKLKQQASRYRGSWMGWSAIAVMVILAYQLLMAIHAVPENEGLVVVKKWGAPPEWQPHQMSASIIAEPGQRGIQPEPLGEGIHFLLPVLYDTHRIKTVNIPPDHVGIVVKLHGKPLPAGRVLAPEGYKGIREQILKPGRHLINDLAEMVKPMKAAIVPPGHVGVQVRYAGSTASGEGSGSNRDDAYVRGALGDAKGAGAVRGVLRDTRSAGTHYVNPFRVRIIPVDVRSKLLKMSARSKVVFPSSDGFDITLEGEVRWRINPDEAAEAYVKFIDERHESAQEAIESKLILPEARAFSRIEGSKFKAADFIDGTTRALFQKTFSEKLQEKCKGNHIIIEAARITDIQPPEEIASIIRKRYMLKEQYKALEAEIEAEKEQVTFRKSQVLQDREKELKAIAAEMESKVTEANQKKQVGIIKARQAQQVALQKLKATEFQVKAMIEKARARAEVIKKQNAAEAAGFRVSQEAFGSGDGLAHFELMRKLAPSIRYIVGNTEGEFSGIFRDVFKNALEKRTTEKQAAPRKRAPRRTAPKKKKEPEKEPEKAPEKAPEREPEREPAKEPEKADDPAKDDTPEKESK